MKTWFVGFAFATVFCVNALYTPQPLAVIDWLLGVFCYVVICVNYYGKK
jgi:hypothetical protein